MFRCLSALLTLALTVPLAAAPGYVLAGWNDLGMHCMDGDYTVFAILPPYNTIHAQLIDSAGHLVKAPGGITVTYAAVRDADGSINTTSQRKTGFWTYVAGLFGASLQPNQGLAGFNMPGPDNAPQSMRFDTAQNWFTAEGIPITVYDDARNRNSYPMMRLTAKDASGNTLASTDIVLPISDEMDCRVCHASGARPETRPRAGYANDPVAERDFKLNILRLHDERMGTGLYARALAGRPALCATCHASNALAGTGAPGIPPLTQSIHGFHAHVTDLATGTALDAAGNRDACYRCHPGSQTRCLRGAMGNAVAADGTMAMQCQSCHGSMSDVGASTRQGWLEEPKCQSCHTGGARYTSVFDNGVPRSGDALFATSADAPAAGLSLYRFSFGHGNLACEACHGSTHAEYPSSHANDNVQSVAIQKHAGVLSECSVCHSSVQVTANGGPHGMHTVGQAWVQAHPDVAERGTAACRQCHGADLRGSPLSRALADRSIGAGRFGTVNLWRGFQVGCYVCHNGPGGESRTTGTAPTAGGASLSVTTGSSAGLALPVSGTMVSARIVRQPQHGTVALSGSNATYYAAPDYEGADTFSYAATDGMIESNLGSVQVTVTASSHPTFDAGVVNAASFKPGPIAPGEIVTIFGSSIGPSALTTLQLNSAGLVSRLLAGTRVLFDGMPAPVVYTSALQVSAVAPYGLAGSGSTQLQVEYQGIRSTPATLSLAPTAPGIFNAVLNEDGKVNSAQNPAGAGSTIVFWVTGEGAATTDVIDGQVSADPYPKPSATVTVSIGGKDAGLAYAGAAPGVVAGVMQVNAKVPQGLAPGSVSIVVSVGGVSSQPQAVFVK